MVPLKACWTVLVAPAQPPKRGRPLGSVKRPSLNNGRLTDPAHLDTVPRGTGDADGPGGCSSPSSAKEGGSGAERPPRFSSPSRPTAPPSLVSTKGPLVGSGLPPHPTAAPVRTPLCTLHGRASVPDV